MSDPAKSEQIEDVLSSIRRLVTEHDPRRAAEEMSVSRQATPLGDDNRLVLTPSLRITDPDDPWVKVTPHPEQLDDALPNGEADWVEQIWKLSDDDGLSFADAKPAASAKFALTEAFEHAAIDEPVPESIRAETDVSLFADDVDDEPSSIVTETAPREAGEAPVSAEPAQAPLIQADADLNGYTEDQDFDPLIEMSEWTDEKLPVPTLEIAAARAEAETAPILNNEDDRDDDGDSVGVAPEELPETKAEAPGADIQDHEAINDPTEVKEADVLQAEQQPISDEAIADTKRSYGAYDERDIEDLGDSADGFTFPDIEDGIIDEEVLRDLISEVVRQELQGALGQRITRNVRKLVRREIRLALAAEDLD
ncbi:MAG: hypothetical protein ACI8TF_002884 [Paracoccaceae bacterium]|jgi:hypothetical protein